MCGKFLLSIFQDTNELDNIRTFTRIFGKLLKVRTFPWPKEPGSKWRTFPGNKAQVGTLLNTGFDLNIFIHTQSGSGLHNLWYPSHRIYYSLALSHQKCHFCAETGCITWWDSRRHTWPQRRCDWHSRDVPTLIGYGSCCNPGNGTKTWKSLG